MQMGTFFNKRIIMTMESLDAFILEPFLAKNRRAAKANLYNSLTC